MKISAILSFFCLFAVAIVPSASAALEAHARRSASIAANKKSRTNNVRALQEHFKNAAAAAKAAPEDGGVATTPRHHGRALFLEDLLALIFGGGDDKEDEEDGDGLDILGIGRSNLRYFDSSAVGWGGS